MTKMTPPIKDLLPRLTPILKNRHEKVQENCIDLVGRIADRGPEYVIIEIIWELGVGSTFFMRKIKRTKPKNRIFGGK